MSFSNLWLFGLYKLLFLNEFFAAAVQFFLPFFQRKFSFSVLSKFTVLCYKLKKVTFYLYAIWTVPQHMMLIFSKMLQNAVFAGHELPMELPKHLIPPSKRNLAKDLVYPTLDDEWMQMQTDTPNWVGKSTSNPTSATNALNTGNHIYFFPFLNWTYSNSDSDKWGCISISIFMTFIDIFMEF